MKKKTRNVYFRLISEMREYRIRLILTAVFTFVLVTANALAPYYLGICIDQIGTLIGMLSVNAVAEGIFDVFLKNLILLLVCYGVNALFTLLVNFAVVRISQDMMQNLRRRVNEKLSKLPVSYYDQRSYGDILSIMTNDMENISNMLTSGMAQIVSGVMTIAVVLFMMIRISGRLTIVAVFTVPVLLIIGTALTRKSRNRFAAQMAGTAELNSYVEEYYTGHDLVALFGRKKSVNDGFSRRNEYLFREAKEGFFIAGLLPQFAQFVNNIGYVLIVLAGTLMMIAGGFSIGTIQSFIQYLIQFTTPINNLTQLTGTIQAGGAAAARLFELLDEEEEPDEPAETGFPAAVKGSVVFDNVTFGYQKDRILMDHLNLSVSPGEKMAIVGPTGAGKTTLVNLLMRFYDLNGGRILIDGTDISKMKRETLRSQFGMVLQDTWLFHGTIRENILYSRPDADETDVIRAAKAARAHDFIMKLPGDYDFVLSEGAENIAHGQRQLLTIARAVLSDPPIMILDEATSSVDTRTEVQIQEAMADLMRGRTSFVIAHRLSTIVDSSRILYMEGGTILEIGSHRELMEKNGKYAKLYNSQFA